MVISLRGATWQRGTPRPRLEKGHAQVGLLVLPEGAPAAKALPPDPAGLPPGSQTSPSVLSLGLSGCGLPLPTALLGPRSLRAP